jgi:predicted nucleic-acid-binding Zn-ribbon protein
MYRMIFKGVFNLAKKKKKSKQTKKEDYGSMEFYCKKCDYTFEVEWELIWEIQELTHGYVGYHLYDTYISCPKCDEIVSDEQHIQDTTDKMPNKIVSAGDDYIPF